MERGHGRPENVLVVGWGFLGSAVGRVLLSEGLCVRTLTRTAPASANRSLRGIDVMVGEIETPTLKEALEGVDHVIYCAGGSMPATAENDPLDDVIKTVPPVICLLEEISSRGSIGLTYLSSGGTVYGNPTQQPVPETAPLMPVSAYGISRLAGELYARKYAATHGVPVTVARCANVYGPGQASDRGQGAVGVFLHRVRQNLPITIYGDGDQIRDYVHVDDVARAISTLVANGVQGRIVNIGSGRGQSVNGVLELICTVIGAPATVEYKPAREHDVRSIVLDIRLLQSLIDYQPRSLEAGVRDLISDEPEESDSVTEVA